MCYVHVKLAFAVTCKAHVSGISGIGYIITRYLGPKYVLYVLYSDTRVYFHNQLCEKLLFKHFMLAGDRDGYQIK